MPWCASRWARTAHCCATPRSCWAGAPLTAYGTSLNLVPVEFAAVTGLYVARLFVVFQITNYILLHTAPTLPVMVGGSLIVAGGLTVYLWK